MAKYVFDFDDVLFFNTEQFKKHMYACFEEAGVPHDVIKEYYQKEKDKGFVLKNLVFSTVAGTGVAIDHNELTEMIMGKCQDFVNTELIDRIKTLGKDNCSIVTHGVTDYQLEKIDRVGIRPLFGDVYVVQDTKKGSVESICKKFNDETVIFVDDKEERFADLDYKGHPNLKTVLYIGPESIQEIFEIE